MPASLYEIATASPRESIAQGAAAQIAKLFLYNANGTSRAVEALYRRTRVARRGSVLLEQPEGVEPRQSFYGAAQSEEDRGPATRQRMQRYADEAAPLALEAAGAALQNSPYSPSDVTHLVTVSCTGFDAPGVEFALIPGLGLPPTVGRVNVGFMGCHGALNGLRVAEAFARSDPRAVVLLTAIELCSLHYQYGGDPQQLVANALFADGAAAVVLDGRTGEDARWQLAGCGSCMLPESADAMTWRIGNHGFEMTLSARVPELIARHLRPWMEHWLCEHGLRLEEIASWAIHPGGPRILETASEALSLPPDATQVSADVLRGHGNMSSATVFFVLRRLQSSAAPRPCVALGFGPGLVAEAALFR